MIIFIDTAKLSKGKVNYPLAQFSIWSEYLWQDYEGCYFDPKLGEYVYYDEE